MLSQTKSDRRRRVVQWISTFFGSVSIATGSTLLLSSLLSPKILIFPAPSTPKTTEKLSPAPPLARPISVVQRKIAGVPLYQVNV
ncbi:hypothetical protein [Phormidesmis priestleyi]